MAKQLNLIPKISKEYGGDLQTTRKGRAHGRPLATKESMHLVLRSTLAKGEWSFKRPQNQKKITLMIQKFSQRHGVKVESFANVGNHLHLHIRLLTRASYAKFIRALTAAIAMAITGINRWTKAAPIKIKFWDRRPYTRIVVGRRSFVNVRKYVQVNQLEGDGLRRHVAEWIANMKPDRRAAPDVRRS